MTTGKSQPKISVVMVTTSYPVEATSPTGVFVKRLAEALANHVSVHVIAPSTDTDIPTAGPDSDQVKVTLFRYGPRTFQRLAQSPGGIPAALRNRPLLWLVVPIFLLSMFWAVLRATRKADLIHANWTVCGAVAALASLLTGRPLITTVRGEDGNRAMESTPSRLLLIASAKRSTHIVAVSNGLLDNVRKVIRKCSARTLLIANGVSHEFLEIEEQKSDGGVIEIVVIGSLIERKNPKLALDAFIQAHTSKCQLKFYGDGPLSAELKEIAARTSQPGSVSFSGQVSPAHMPNILSKANIVVVPSRSEGRSNAILEAMAAARTVIATDIPGNNELIGDGITGLLVDNNNLDAMTAALQRLINDHRLRQALGRAARQWIIANDLTWERTADSYIQIYSEALQRDSAKVQDHAN